MSPLFCGYCGKPVQPGWVCCGHCGRTLAPRPAQEPAPCPRRNLPRKLPFFARKAARTEPHMAPKKRGIILLASVVLLAVGIAALLSMTRTKAQNQLALAATEDFFVRASADWQDSLTLREMRVLEHSRTGQVLVEFTYTADDEPAQEPTLAWMVFQSVTDKSYSVTPEAWTPQYWPGAGPDVAKSQNGWDSTPSSMVTTYPLGGAVQSPADPDTFFARWSDTIDVFAQVNTRDGVLDEDLAQFLESCRLSAANFAEGRGQGKNRYYFERDDQYTLVLVSDEDGVFTSCGVTCGLSELTEDFSMAQIQSVCMAQGLMPEATPEQTYETLLNFFQTLEQGTTQEVLWQRLLLRGYVDSAGVVQFTMQLQ